MKDLLSRVEQGTCATDIFDHDRRSYSISAASTIHLAAIAGSENTLAQNPGVVYPKVPDKFNAWIRGIKVFKQRVMSDFCEVVHGI